MYVSLFVVGHSTSNCNVTDIAYYYRAVLKNIVQQLTFVRFALAVNGVETHKAQP